MIKTVAVRDVFVRINETEDRRGDEPVIVLGLATVDGNDNRSHPIPRSIDVHIFDSGILGDNVENGKEIRVPIAPPGADDANTKTYQGTLDTDTGGFFLLFAQAWDDDESSVSKREANRKLLRDAVLDTFEFRGNFDAQINEVATAACNTVGRDDLLGQDGKIFRFNPGTEDFRMTLTGLDDDASYTLRGTVVWGDV